MVAERPEDVAGLFQARHLFVGYQLIDHVRPPEVTVAEVGTRYSTGADLVKLQHDLIAIVNEPGLRVNLAIAVGNVKSGRRRKSVIFLFPALLIGCQVSLDWLASRFRLSPRS